MVASVPTPSATLQVRDLRVTYSGTEVLHGIDLDVRSNEIFGIIGPAGSGKTSFLRAVMGHLAVAGGTLQYGVELLVEENDVSTALFVELPGIEAPTIVGVGDPTVQIAIDLDL